MVAVLRSDVVRHRAVVVGTAAGSCSVFWTRHEVLIGGGIPDVGEVERQVTGRLFEA